MGEVALRRGIDVINAKAENIPVMDQTYDLVAMITVDCFLDDILKAFSEVWRILESNGYFIIAFIDKATNLGQLYDEKKKSNIFYKNAKFHSSTEIITVLKNTGFKIIDKRQTIYSLHNIIHESKSGVGEGVFAIIKAKKI